MTNQPKSAPPKKLIVGTGTHDVARHVQEDRHADAEPPGEADLEALLLLRLLDGWLRRRRDHLVGRSGWRVGGRRRRGGCALLRRRIPLGGRQGGGQPKRDQQSCKSQVNLPHPDLPIRGTVSRRTPLFNVPAALSGRATSTSTGALSGAEPSAGHSSFTGIEYAHRRRYGRLRPTASFLLILIAGRFLRWQHSDSTAGPRGKKTAEQKSRSSRGARTRRTDLDELDKEDREPEDRAAAAMMEKELSDRRARYRRDVSKLVDARHRGRGRRAPPSRTAAPSRPRSLEEDARDAPRLGGAQTRESSSSSSIAGKGKPRGSRGRSKKLDSAIPASSRLMEYLDVNIDERSSSVSMSRRTPRSS